MDKSCFYCTKDHRLSDLVLEIMKLDISTLFLARDQTYKGKCVLALNCHKTELYDLSSYERELFIKDAARAAGAIHKVFHPDKINYAVYGDLVPHLHMHIVPKYADGSCWGIPFDISPEQKILMTDEEYMSTIQLIKKNLAV